MIITLLSDYGYKDHYIAKVKGILLHQSYIDKIIDITHDVTPMSYLHGSYTFKNAYSYFPSDTVHISLMSIMEYISSEENSTAIMCYRKGQYIICADNGFLPFTFSKDEIQAFQLPVSAVNYYDWIQQVSDFIGAWHLQPKLLEQLPIITPKVTVRNIATIFKEDSIETYIVYIDHYCNIILNITKDQFESARRGRNFEIQFARSEKINKIHTNYHDVDKSNMLCRFNSDGYMEIAIRNGQAAELLGMHVYNSDNLIYNTIKILFRNK